MSFRRRTFPEVLESLLTSLTGGVAAETPPVPAARCDSAAVRERAAAAARRRRRLGLGHARRRAAPVPQERRLQALRPTGARSSGRRGRGVPDPGTLISSTTGPPARSPTLTDLQVGSVLRTLAETTALEIARLYALLESVYRSGFVDTATDARSTTSSRCSGSSGCAAAARPARSSSRAPGALGEITIPAGTRVVTADGGVEYETTETVTMRPARARSASSRATWSRTTRCRPARSRCCRCRSPASRRSRTRRRPRSSRRDESDDELRTRAKNFLHGSERATLGAIQQAMHGAGITADIDEDVDARRRPDHAARRGDAAGSPAAAARARSRTCGRRASSSSSARPRRRAKVNLELRLETASRPARAGPARGAAGGPRRGDEFFAQLPVREAASINQLVGRVLAVPGVQDVTIVAATVTSNGGPPTSVLDTAGGKLDIEGFPTVLGDLHIADPNLPTLLDVTVSLSRRRRRRPTRRRSAPRSPTRSPPSTPRTRAVAAGAVSFAQLLAATPLPGVAARRGDPLPYVVKYVFTLESGLSQVLGRAGDDVRARPRRAAGAERRPCRGGRTVGRFESLRDRLPSLYRPDADEAVEPLFPLAAGRPRRGADGDGPATFFVRARRGRDAARRFRRAVARLVAPARARRRARERLRAGAAIRSSSRRCSRRSRPRSPAPSMVSRRCGSRSSSDASACS